MQSLQLLQITSLTMFLLHIIDDKFKHKHRQSQNKIIKVIPLIILGYK